MFEEGEPDEVEEKLHQQWTAVRLRLQGVMDRRSVLDAALSAYAIDHAGDLRLEDVRAIRTEYGVAADPPAEELLPLLRITEQPSMG
ncbi:hypothetical protein [Microbacterium sp. 1P06AB]|uniref:hypothetical protein n=1 Tax=Microbacterium sp. 1P06AB TaxID=3132289 RepID=UPI0039A6B8C8